MFPGYLAEINKLFRNIPKLQNLEINIVSLASGF